MTLLLRGADVDEVISVELALDALREALLLEARGKADVPPRLTTGPAEGWLRLMPAVLPGRNGNSTMGFKAMNLRRGEGVRYLLMLYDSTSGELVAIMDAGAVTRVRTAAMTALAAKELIEGDPTELGVFGSGYEATSHVEAMKTVFPSVERLRVYSPRPERREAFATRMSSTWQVDAQAVDEPRDAALSVTVLATRATSPVAQAEWFDPGAVVLSIGSTRLDLRELDERLFARARWCLCDAPDQVATESGDVDAALQSRAIAPDQLVRLAHVVAGDVALATGPDDVRIFKSVGTALQDLAVGHAVLEGCRATGLGTDLGRFPIKH